MNQNPHVEMITKRGENIFLVFDREVFEHLGGGVSRAFTQRSHAHDLIRAKNRAAMRSKW